MTRLSAIKKILEKVKDQVVVSSTGMISREVHMVKDRPRNFYMMGSMGCALAIGIGIAYSRPDLKVIVINGDASVLMSLGTLVLYEKLALPNLKHYVLNNNCHASTGGQPTVSNIVDFGSLSPDTCVYQVSNEKGTAPRILLRPGKITKRFKYAIGCDIT